MPSPLGEDQVGLLIIRLYQGDVRQYSKTKQAIGLAFNYFLVVDENCPNNVPIALPKKPHAAGDSTCM